ncbi:MAG: serine O-acetyltransferase [Planctomycetota bacterium]|jgi:serine O-acetyltransferase
MSADVPANSNAPSSPEAAEPERSAGLRSVGLWTLIREDLAAHGGDWQRPGFRALVTYRFGVWRMGVRPKLLRAPLSVLYRWMFRRSCWKYGIELPYSSRIGRRVVFEHQHGIVIHGSAEIGDGCVLRQGVTLGNRRDDRPFNAPILGRNVNVGAGAKILGKIRVGDGAHVGANAVVVHDVAPGATVVGIPARPVGSVESGSVEAGQGGDDLGGLRVVR